MSRLTSRPRGRTTKSAHPAEPGRSSQPGRVERQPTPLLQRLSCATRLLSARRLQTRLEPVGEQNESHGIAIARQWNERFGGSCTSSARTCLEAAKLHRQRRVGSVDESSHDGDAGTRACTSGAGSCAQCFGAPFRVRRAPAAAKCVDRETVPSAKRSSMKQSTAGGKLGGSGSFETEPRHGH